MKRLLLGLLHAMGVTGLAAWWYRKQVIILNYHSITEQSEDDFQDDLNVHPERFAAQLDYLQSRYRIISLREFLKARQEGRTLPDYSVIITFDDGYRNFLTTAAPLLHQRSMPATVFLITGMTRRDENGPADLFGSVPDEDRERLSWADVRALQQTPGIDFGSHSFSHPSLTELSPEEAEREMRDSLAALSEHARQAIPALAYPNGAYSAAIAIQARALGYTCALTIDQGVNKLTDDPFTLRRQTVRGSDDVAVFAARVSCLTWWLVRGRDRIRKYLRPIPETRTDTHQGVGMERISTGD